MILQNILSRNILLCRMILQNILSRMILLRIFCRLILSSRIILQTDSVEQNHYAIFGGRIRAEWFCSTESFCRIFLAETFCCAEWVCRIFSAEWFCWLNLHSRMILLRIFCRLIMSSRIILQTDSVKQNHSALILPSRINQCCLTNQFLTDYVGLNRRQILGKNVDNSLRQIFMMKKIRKNWLFRHKT